MLFQLQTGRSKARGGGVSNKNERYLRSQDRMMGKWLDRAQRGRREKNRSPPRQAERAGEGGSDEMGRDDRG